MYKLFFQHVQAPATFSDIVFILIALLSYLQYSKYAVLVGIEDPIFLKKGKNSKVNLEKLEACIYSVWCVAETRLDVVKW